MQGYEFDLLVDADPNQWEQFRSGPGFNPCGNRRLVVKRGPRRNLTAPEGLLRDPHKKHHAAETLFQRFGGSWLAVGSRVGGLDCQEVSWLLGEGPGVVGLLDQGWT